jgi:DNA-binding LytR/AlgR family response regulator
MIRCIIVDDEELAQNVLEKYISSVPWMALLQKFDNAIETIAYLRDNSVDLMFLDIRMPELSGLKMLNTLKDPPKVILTTAYSEYALESYKYAVTDYLLKPIELDRFLIAVNKVLNQIQLESSSKDQLQESASQAKYLFVYQDQNTYKIDFEDILYIKAEGNYISIKTKDKNFITRETMKDIERRLDDNIFIRVNKSYIVSIPKIMRVFGNTIVIAEEKIPIGKIYKMKVFDKINPA